MGTGTAVIIINGTLTELQAALWIALSNSISFERKKVKQFNSAEDVSAWLCGDIATPYLTRLFFKLTLLTGKFLCRAC